MDKNNFFWSADDVNGSGNDDDDMMMIMGMAIVRVKGPLRLETDVSTS